MKGEKREKVGSFEMARNGLVVRVQVTVKAGGRRSKWTPTLVGSVSDAVTVHAMNHITQGSFWEWADKQADRDGTVEPPPEASQP